MLIECPRCHVRATLPDEKDGAKVRCGECARVFVARSIHEKGERNEGVPSWVVVGGITAGIAVLAFLFARSRSSPTPTHVPAPPPTTAGVKAVEAAELATDWSAPAVQAAARIHDESFTRNEVVLRSMLCGPRLFERQRAEGTSTVAAEKAYKELSEVERADVFRLALDDLIHGPGRELVADWRAFDGSVIESDGADAVVHVSVTPRDGSSVEKRTVEWKLAKEDGKWRAWSWTRYLSPQEALREKRLIESKAYQKVKLSDGSVVFERDPEPLPHLADTPPELRTRIDQLYATMTNLELTKESSRALAELIEIGRPAIPVLLTGLYQTPLDGEDNLRRANLIDQALRVITGFDTGFKPQLQEGSGVGTTEERQTSSVRQWFAWWYQNQKKFVAAEEKDALEGLIELSEEEKRFLERHKD